jgi:hypothetical protein
MYFIIINIIINLKYNAYCMIFFLKKINMIIYWMIF